MMHPGMQLETLISQTRHQLLLVAPFVKSDAFGRVLNQVGESVNVRLVTRWRPDEIASGVSDLDVWLLVAEHSRCTLWLCSDLHAKYYRGDQRVLVGSANLTNAALGWSERPNLELLIESAILNDFERHLFANSVLVDRTVYEQIKEYVEAMPTCTEIQVGPTPAKTRVCSEDASNLIAADAWLPTLRHAEKLYTAYRGELEQLGTGSRVAAVTDLCALDVPLGLTKNQFGAYVGVQLLQKPIIRQIDQLVELPQRFGAVRDFLGTLPCADLDGFDANRAWQTLMRWLLHFLPNRYELTVGRRSEIFSRRK